MVRRGGRDPLDLSPAAEAVLWVVLLGIVAGLAVLVAWGLTHMPA